MAKGLRGRPPLFGEPTVPLMVRVPTSQYDRLCIEAQRQGKELAQHVRERLLYSEIDKRAPRA
jgi:hypothetical protein